MAYLPSAVKRVRPPRGGALVVFPARPFVLALVAIALAAAALLFMPHVLYATSEAASARNANAQSKASAQPKVYGAEYDAARSSSGAMRAKAFRAPAPLRRDWGEPRITRQIHDCALPSDADVRITALCMQCAEPAIALLARTGSLSSRTTSLPPPRAVA